MCIFKPNGQTMQQAPAQNAPPPPAPVPQKSSDLVQKETESDRMNNSKVHSGIASTILTSGLGVTTPANVRGVVLGV
jgi:hypothetical protein